MTSPRHHVTEGDALRREIERLADSFERQEYEDWSGEELAALMREVLAKASRITVALECGHTRQLAAGIVRAMHAGHFAATWCDHPDCECHRSVLAPAPPSAP